MMLVVIIADMVVNEIPVDRPTVTIGRAPDNDIVLDDPLVSAQHVRLDITPPGAGGVPTVMLEDLGSTNGTRINGKGVHRQRLKSDDEIQIGRSSLRLIEDR